MDRVFLATLGCVVLSGAIAAEGPIQPPRLVLASWNIAHLARETGAGEVPRSTEDYARLRDRAASLGADIVALQEVQGAGAARRLFDARAWDFHFAASWIVPGSFRQVQYRPEDRKHQAKLSDHCAIVVAIP